MIRVSCPKCKAIIQVEDLYEGKIIACQKCKTSLRLPTARSATAPLPPPVTSPPGPPTAANWYFMRNGQRQGPVALEQLRSHIKPTDLLWREGMQKWVQASQLNGLFPQTSPTPKAMPEKRQPVPVARAPATPPSANQFQGLVDGSLPKAGMIENPSMAKGNFQGKKLIAIVGGTAGLCLLVILIVFFSWGTKAKQPGLAEAPKDTTLASKESGSSGNNSTVAETQQRGASTNGGGSGSSSKDYLAGIDFTKGPNGETVSKHFKADQMIEGYTKETIVAKEEFVPALKATLPVRRKATVIVNHGLMTRYWDKDKATKHSEGYFFNGEPQGIHRIFNRDGKVVEERTYEKGNPRDVHKGTLLNGKGEWSITYADNGLVDLTKTPCGGFLSQFLFVSGAGGCRIMNLVEGNDEFGYLWMARLRGGNNQFTTRKLESWFGPPNKLPGATSSEERWQYRCKDGLVELRVVPLGSYNSILGPDLYSTTKLP